jgi:hypothetical protein
MLITTLLNGENNVGLDEFIYSQKPVGTFVTPDRNFVTYNEK